MIMILPDLMMIEIICNNGNRMVKKKSCWQNQGRKTNCSNNIIQNPRQNANRITTSKIQHKRSDKK